MSDITNKRRPRNLFERTTAIREEIEKLEGRLKKLGIAAKERPEKVFNYLNTKLDEIGITREEASNNAIMHGDYQIGFVNTDRSSTISLKNLTDDSEAGFIGTKDKAQGIKDAFERMGLHPTLEEPLADPKMIILQFNNRDILRAIAKENSREASAAIG